MDNPESQTNKEPPPLMLKNLLVNSYGILIEISLWLLLLFSIIGGAMAAGIQGAIAGLLGAFLFAVLFAAPFLLIEDIRDKVKRIEQSKSSG